MHFVSTVEFGATTWHHSPPSALNESFCRAGLASAARVAKLADALDLGSCALNGVGVQLPPLAIIPSKAHRGPECPKNGTLGPLCVSRHTTPAPPPKTQPTPAHTTQAQNCVTTGVTTPNPRFSPQTPPIIHPRPVAHARDRHAATTLQQPK